MTARLLFRRQTLDTMRARLPSLKTKCRLPDDSTLSDGESRTAHLPASCEPLARWATGNRAESATVLMTLRARSAARRCRVTQGPPKVSQRGSIGLQQRPSDREMRLHLGLQHTGSVNQFLAVLDQPQCRILHFLDLPPHFRWERAAIMEVRANTLAQAAMAIRTDMRGIAEQLGA